MDILLIAATEAEIAPLAKLIANNRVPGSETAYHFAWGRLVVCVAGVGMVATAYALTKQLAAHRYDIVVQAGIGGAYNRQLQLGQVVQVLTEQYGDMGAQDHDSYIDIYTLGLLDGNTHPYIEGKLPAPETEAGMALQLQVVSGITVNTVSGNEATIARMQNKYASDTESMEGAAMHYVCLMEDVPFLQLRAISNYVEPRDRGKWDIPLAVHNLNDVLAKLFNTIL
jgi:futalosine hydrolase